MVRKLGMCPVHLGLEGKAVAQPEFTGLSWYADYVQRTAGDGAEGRLVSLFAFTENWDSWEMHPQGEEVVICIAGALTLVQECPDGEPKRIMLNAGDYAINPRGVWHTADVDQAASAIFITAGAGTRHRPR